jgi:hypothetical protein
MRRWGFEKVLTKIKKIGNLIAAADKNRAAGGDMK